MVRKRAVGLIVVAVASLMLVGCGGKKSSSGTRSATTSTGSALSDAEYRARAAAITKSYGAAGRALKASVGPRSTPRQVASALQAFQTRAKGAVDKLAAIRPPRKVAAPQLQLVEAFRASAQATQPSIDAGRTRNRRRYRVAFARFRVAIRELRARAHAAAREIDARLGR